MPISASLALGELAVAPGTEVATELTVRNTGTVVDQFTFQPLGVASGWMAIEPPTVSLFPGGEQVVRVVFRPPKASAVMAGAVPYAIRVLPREDPQGALVVEGIVVVAPFDDRSVEVTPRSARGRRVARFDLAFDNRGNVPAAPRLGATDPEGQLRFAFSPPVLSVEAGKARFSKVAVRPRKVFWKGPPQPHPFQFVIDEDGKEPLVLDAIMVQEASLPPWIWTVAALAAAALLALVVLWFTILKPTIKSTARDAVAKPVGDINKRLDSAGIPPAGAGGGGAKPPTTAGGAAGGTAGGAAGGPAGGAAGGGSATTSNTTAVPVPAGGAPFTLSGQPLAFRLAPTNAAPPNGTDVVSHTTANGQVFQLTDLVLQNPNGDSGTITIARGSDALFVSSLQNFRDLDFHFVAPYLFFGQPLTVTVLCTAAGNGAPKCTPSVSASGFVR